MNVSSQVIGLFALFFMCLSYQKKTKKDFLFIQIIANAFYGLQYLLLNALSALASNIISIIRSLTFYKYEKNSKEVPLSLFLIFEIVIVVFGIITFKNYYSIIPIFIACIYTYATWQKNLKRTYFIGIIAAILWIYYNFVVGAYVSIIGSLFELFSSFIGLIRLKYINPKKERHMF